MVSSEHGLFSPYNVSSVGNNLLITKSLWCGGEAKTPERKGGNHCTSLVSVNYLSASSVDFRALSHLPGKMLSVMVLPLCCRESTTSGLPQFHTAPGIQDKRNVWAQQNAFSKTVPFLLCLDLNKTKGKTKGMNLENDTKAWNMTSVQCELQRNCWLQN